MLTAFLQSIKSLRANLGRTILTTLGIVIGITTVILVLSAGSGFRSLINSQVEAFGNNTLFIETRVPSTTKNRGSGAVSADQGRANAPIAISSFKNRDLEEIKNLPNVIANYGMVVGQKVVSYGNVNKNVLFYGASSSRFEIDKGTLKFGRFYTQAEDSGASQVVILGSNLVADLFGQDEPVGKLVRVGELNFQVIGVYNPRGGFGGNENDALYMPLRTAQKKVLGIDYLLIGIVQVKNPALAEATAEDVRALMRRSHSIIDHDKDDFLVQTQAQGLKTFNTIFNGITALLIAIATISLVVGGVGIMNIMYVAVTERTAEIGLKKALGAKSKDILKEFLMEAVLVTVVGGVLGVALGAGLGWAVSLVARALGLVWEFSVPLYSIILATSASALIGIGFGVLPARAASKLDPIEALRYE